MTFPDRISPLIERLERGLPISKEDLHRMVAIQALDLARIGEDFAREGIQREREHTERFRQSEEKRREQS